MGNQKSTQLDRIKRYAEMIQKRSGRAVRPYRADGYVNMMTRYGTQKDSSENYKYVPEGAVPDELLTVYYEENGMFSKIIDTPAEEAIKHGFKLEDVSDRKIEDFYIEALDELDWDETAITCLKWARLFGGSLAVMLINDGRGLDEPLDWKNIQSIDDIRVFDRSVVQPDYTSMFNYNPRDPFSTRGSRLGMPEYYQVFSKYGSFTVHDSRCLVFQNGILPENTTNSIYQLWGVPEYVRLNKALQDAEVAHRSALKMLDRSVQAIYKMRNLSEMLATEEGENIVLKRLQVIDLARGLLNSLVIDAEGEDYDFKTFQFSGINDVVNASCNMLSALSNIPQAILFGQSVGGLSSTDDTSMENYYNFVERIQRRMLKSNLRYLLSIVFQAGLSTGEVDEIPKLKIKFNPLWSLNDVEQADLEQKKEQTKLTRAQTAQLYINMQAVDPSEVRKKLADSEEFDVEAMLDEYDDDELFPEQSATEGLVDAQGQPVRPGTGTNIFEHGSLTEYGQDVSVEEHNADPETGGNAPAAAPAATKLPQDLSEEEIAAKLKNSTNNGDGGPGSGNFGHEGREGKVGGSSPGDANAERCGKISARLNDINKSLTERFSEMAEGKRPIEDIMKDVQSLVEESNSLKKELERFNPSSETNVRKRLGEEGHPTKKTLEESIPIDWRNSISTDGEQTNWEAFSSNLSSWCGEGYNEMKHDPVLSKAIELSTAKWNRGDLYRGMSISRDQLDSIVPGCTLQMDGLSSWSSDLSPAMSFATVEKNPVLIVDKTKGTKNAVPIAHISNRSWEKEVIYGKDQAFVVKRVYAKGVSFGTSASGSASDFSKQTTRKVTVIEVESDKTDPH